MGSCFASLGLAPGERVALLSNTRREWLATDLAIQAAGGVTVGIYATMTADQARYIIEHSEARFVVVEDRKQLVKVQQHLAELAAVKNVIVIDPTDTADGEGRVLPLAEVRGRGEGRGADVDARLAKLAARRSGPAASLARWTLAWMSYQEHLSDAVERFTEFAVSASTDEERAQGTYWQSRAGESGVAGPAGRIGHTHKHTLPRL